MLDKQVVNKVEKIVKPEYEKLECWAHAWSHIRRVGNDAYLLANLVGANPFVCQIAAYCHDLGRIIEQENTGKKIELGNVDHSSDSIEPTTAVLKEANISGQDFNSIVGAVAVHSDKLYSGKNLVAKVLRDCDKNDSFGPWGVLRHVKHHFDVDLVPTKEIMNSQYDSSKIENLADETLRQIKKDSKKLPEYLRVLDFVLEWVDKKMLDNEQAYDFVKKGYLYIAQARKFLTK